MGRMKSLIQSLVHVRLYTLTHSTTTSAADPHSAIVDTGNNRHHTFTSAAYFPLGVRYHTLPITGCHGTKSVTVGVGTACFATLSNSGNTILWSVPDSILNPTNPINLLCHDRFHYTTANVRTGHEIHFLKETLTTNTGSVIPVIRDPHSHLPIMRIRPYTTKEIARHPRSPQYSINTHFAALLTHDTTGSLQAFTHTQLRPITTHTAWRILGCPLERYFNMTINKNMIDGITGVRPLTKHSKGDRPDMWYAGKMTHRTVPQTSRRPDGITLTPGSHITSDIGYVSVPDRMGNKYFVLFKDMCTQYRTVYRMKRKSDIVGIWKQFVADHQYQDVQGHMYCSIRYLVTDADKSYIEGQVKETNTKHLISKYTLSPYNHQANPAESEMRRLMEGAVSNLYDSGLPPSFLLDALDCHVHCVNRLYTPVHHRERDVFRTPYERMFNSKPSLADVARFGCKTHVFVPKTERSGKHDTHKWTGFYLGPSPNMRACCVYRPSQHKVYHRYHTLHDPNVVYGDVMGETYKQRVQTDREMREYYNNEVKDLLSSDTAGDWVRDLLRALPWTPQPIPRATPTPPAPPTNKSPPTPHPTLRRSARLASTCTAADTPPTKRRAPSHSISPSGTSSSSSTPFSRALEPARAKQLLDITNLTCQYSSLVDSLQVLDDTVSHDTLTYLNSHFVTDPTQHMLVQLCEQTSRRIASTAEPKTQRAISKLEGVEKHLVEEAMHDEVKWMLEQGKVQPVDRRNLAKHINEIDGKWVVKYKKTLQGLLERVRARWVLRGDMQVPHVDFDPDTIYSPVASKSATLTICALALQYSLDLYCVDVSKAFTVSTIEPGVYMKVPTGVCTDTHPDIAPYGSHTTWELLTTLYGLKQASAKYYHTFANILLAHTDSNGNKFRRSDHDPCVFVKGALGSASYTILSIHIDDKFIACSGKKELDEFTSILSAANFKHTVEDMKQVLGMAVTYVKHDPSISNSGSITFDHSQYIRDAYKLFAPHFKHVSADTASIPLPPEVAHKPDPDPNPVYDKARYKLFRSIIGKVSHVANFTHPEISTAVSIVSSKMSNPSTHDLDNAFHILRYLHGTVNNPKAKLTFHFNKLHSPTSRTKQHPIHLNCDADLANCKTTRRSRTGYAAFLFGNLVGWNTRRQPSVSLSTAESEYMAISAAAQFGKWYKGLVGDMGLELAIYEPMVILTDSKSAMHIANSEVSQVNKYSKHISVRVHWFRELIRDGTLRIHHTPGKTNVADIFTKALARKLFIQCRDTLLHGERCILRNLPGLKCFIMHFPLLPMVDGSNKWSADECPCHHPVHFTVCPTRQHPHAQGECGLLAQACVEGE